MQYTDKRYVSCVLKKIYILQEIHSTKIIAIYYYSTNTMVQELHAAFLV